MIIRYSSEVVIIVKLNIIEVCKTARGWLPWDEVVDRVLNCGDLRRAESAQL